MDPVSLAAIETLLKKLATEKVEASTQTEILLSGFEKVIYAIPPTTGKRVRTEEMAVKTPSSSLSADKTPTSTYSWKSDEITSLSLRRSDSDSSIVLEHKGHTVLAKMHYKGHKHWWKPKYRIKNSGESWELSLIHI